MNMLASVTDSTGAKIDTGHVRIHFRNAKSLICNDNTTLGEGMVCNWSKVLDAAAEVADGLFTVDRIGVLANGKKSGGVDMSMTIFVTGLGNHTGHPACSFQQQTFDGKMLHELGHTYVGDTHVLLPANKMGSCVNNCCTEGIYPFLPQHQHLIVKNINAKILQ